MSLSRKPTEALSVSPPLDAEAIPAALPAKDERPLSHRSSVGVAAVGGHRLSKETDDLRRNRIRAAAIFFLVAVGLFLVWRLLLPSDDLWPLNLTVMMLLAAVIAALSGRGPVPAWLLRVSEFGAFGGIAGLLAVRQFHNMSVAAASGNPLLIQLAVKDTMIGSIILVFTYAMLIPNRWQRAAQVILAIVALPIAVQALVFLVNPDVPRVPIPPRSRPPGFEPWFRNVSLNGLIMATASGLAVYGTYIINSLRLEAFQARQLNQYQLGERLGTGGMGEIFRAEHRMLKRPCALKLIKPERASDVVSVARFEREVRAAARLSHPNTIDIYDYGHTEDGTFYYVMELLRGMSLAEIVERFGAMPPGRVVYLLRQACEALAEAHAAGLIHRDLKPGNIFAAFRGGRHDEAKILDFGLVKGGEEPDSPLISREGTVRGTPHFMAPEQALARADLDHRVDIYAMGAVAYCLLTGHPPFDGDTAERVMSAHVRDTLTPPRRLNTRIPRDLEAVVLRCLAKERDDRFPDADGLSQALTACGCAADWDHRKAAQWWRLVDSKLV